MTNHHSPAEHHSTPSLYTITSSWLITTHPLNSNFAYHYDISQRNIDLVVNLQTADEQKAVAVAGAAGEGAGGGGGGVGGVQDFVNIEEEFVQGQCWTNSLLALY